MKRQFLSVMLMGIALGAQAAPSSEVKKAWVSADSLNSRTCPASTCGVVKTLAYGDELSVFEEFEGWARVTEYVDARCSDGATPLVARGNNRCLEGNGIKDGLVANWVSGKHIANEQPPSKKKEDEKAARAKPKYAREEFRTMKECLEAIERNTGILGILADRPERVSGITPDNAFFSCDRRATGTRGVIYESDYVVVR